MDKQTPNLFDRLFGLSAAGTNVRTELMAGLTTFLAMCYIIIVNPLILGETGMDMGAVFVATCIASAIGCFVMGFVGNYPMKRALFADSTAIVAGAALGTSSTTPYVESAAGVAAGGRTGLTAVTVGVLMLACLIFSPLVQSIPGFATAPALLYVGAQMLRSAREIDWDDMTEAAPAFLTIVFMPFTYSIADGIAFGFISYAVIKLLCNRIKDVPPMVWIVAVLWALKFWFMGG